MNRKVNSWFFNALISIHTIVHNTRTINCEGNVKIPWVITIAFVQKSDNTQNMKDTEDKMQFSINLKSKKNSDFEGLNQEKTGKTIF